MPLASPGLTWPKSEQSCSVHGWRQNADIPKQTLEIELTRDWDRVHILNTEGEGEGEDGQALQRSTQADEHGSCN